MARPSVGATRRDGACSDPAAPVAQVPSPRPPAEGLENNANNSSLHPSESRRRERYLRRSWLWEHSSASRDDRRRKCGRCRCAMHVTVRCDGQHAGFCGVISCGSVWSCPVCNAKIMKARGDDIADVASVNDRRGGTALFATFTIRHHAGQSLIDLHAAVIAAWGRLTSGRGWREMLARHDVAGWVRVIEVTHGRNGWHVHVHALLLLRGGISDDALADLGGWMAARWTRGVQALGHTALSVGQDLRRIDGKTAGAYLTKSQVMGLELTNAQGKRAGKTVTPWVLLDRAMGGDRRALRLWHEYEQTMKGRRLLGWSRGLRAEMGAGEELTDEEIVEEELGSPDLVAITPEAWDDVVIPRALPVLILEAAERSPGDLRRLLHEHGVEFVDLGGLVHEPSAAPPGSTSAPSAPSGGSRARRAAAARAAERHGLRLHPSQAGPDGGGQVSLLRAHLAGHRPGGRGDAHDGRARGRDDAARVLPLRR